jgi:Family of unknown function (DUF6461)
VGYFRRALLSRGTSVASHLQTVNADTEFSYVRDGVAVLEFEPFYGDFRDAEDAELSAAMQQAGFVRSAADAYLERSAECAFALADLLIGSRLTREQLERATYLYASVPDH